jgi:hypothetical protein
LLDKLGVRDRTHAVVMALKRGIIRLWPFLREARGDRIPNQKLS